MDKNILVLIVEDTPDILLLIKGLLESGGYQVVTADSGEAALEAIAGRTFNAILLDIMLPRVDGFEVAKRVRSNPKTQGVPIIAMTALDVPDIVQKCTSVGINEVVMKPFDPKVLLDLVKKVTQ